MKLNDSGACILGPSDNSTEVIILSPRFKVLSLFLLIVGLVATLGASEFEDSMRQFEEAKRLGDYALCEQILLKALESGASEYANGSLVWARLRLNKNEQALKDARKMVGLYSWTTYSTASLIEAALINGDLDSVREASRQARSLRLYEGSNWTHGMLRNFLKKADEIEKPAVYELTWTIPAGEFNTPNRTKLFGFPLLNTPRQTFEYTISGAVSSKELKADENRTVVRIRGKPSEDVVIFGKASINPSILGAKTFEKLSEIKLEPAPNSETGIFYFWSEQFDPKTPAISRIAKSVRRESAVETVQAILDWRDSQMPYRMLKPSSGSTLERIAEQMCGVCHDASYMTASLARANGIPAVVMGVYVLPTTEEFQNAEGSHGHIRVKLPEVGWTDVEPLDRGSLVMFGRNNYLEFAVQSEKEVLNRASLQGYKVSGRRIH